MPGRRKAKFTDASAMLPRKACSAELRKFVVRLCTIRRASRVSRTDKIRAFCSKIGNRLQLGGRLYTRFPGPKLPSLIIRHANVQSRDIKGKYYNLRITFRSLPILDSYPRTIEPSLSITSLATGRADCRWRNVHDPGRND
jgi:hypothetical protein